MGESMIKIVTHCEPRFALGRFYFERFIMLYFWRSPNHERKKCIGCVAGSEKSTKPVCFSLGFYRK